MAGCASRTITLTNSSPRTMNPTEQPRPPHFERLVNRRDFLIRGGAGFGALALTYLLESERLLAAPALSSSARVADFPAKAKSVIFLFMEGGPSHLDTFDPKPKLREMAGQKLPESFSKNLITAMGEVDSPLLADRREWK